MMHSNLQTTRGFGLTELLVAIAIFLTIIGAISLVFTGSLRSLRQAEQSQQIYEMVRGAMQVMERDLANAFVAREHGDIYQFYGTPIGFTFVGLVKYNEESQPNIARVTYVLRWDSGRAADRSDINEFVDPLTGLSIFENDGIDNDFNGLTDEAGEGMVIPTFSLLRFVERGRDDLESFPIDWTAAIVDDSNPGVPPDTLEDVIGDPTAPDTTYGNFVGNAVDTGLCRPDDVACLSEVAKAGRRQVWIAMLAGTESTWYTTTSEFPDYFDLNPNLDPDDYVLLEDVSVDDLTTAFGEFQLNSAASNIATLPYSPAPDGDYASVTYNGQFFEYTEWVRGLDGAATIVMPNNLAYWLDWRNINLSNNGIDDNGDGLADDNTAYTCIDNATQNPVVFTQAAFCANTITCHELELPIDCGGGDIRFAPGWGPGSPLTPSIPQQVNFRFRLFVESPTVGASDFERNFNFQLDIPSATVRVSTAE